jgi:HD-like signal output (HDOD) protein
MPALTEKKRRDERMEKKKIGELLVQRGYIDTGQLKEALEVQKENTERLCNILIDLGHLSEQSYFEFMREISDTASLDLSGYEVDRKLLQLIRHSVAKQLEIVPIGKMGHLLTVAMVCPLDETAKMELEEVTGLKVQPLLSPRSEVLRVLDGTYRDLEAEDGSSKTIKFLKPNELANLVAGFETLPTLPDVLSLVSSVAQDPSSSPEDLVKVIAADCSLSIRMLKIANLPAYGYSRKVANVRNAVEILGLKEAQKFATIVSVYHPGKSAAAFDFRSHWQHSFACARLAKFISLNLRHSRPEDAFAAGLLHDVGKIVLAIKMNKKQGESVPSYPPDPSVEKETAEASLGFHHSDVGYALGQNWNLPVSLTNAMQYHHCPELNPRARSLSGIVYLANTLCKLDLAELEKITAFSPKMLEALEIIGMSESVLRQTLKVYARTTPRIPVPGKLQMKIGKVGA